MPSDRPPPEPSRPGSDPAGPRRPTAAVRDGTLVFALVLGGFTAYAVGAPATYEATAIVAVSPILGSSPALPGAAEATQRLRRAALEPALVASLVKEERPAPPETAADVSSRIVKTLSIESSAGRTFTFRSTGSSPERAQRIVNALAEQAAKRAPSVLDPQPPPADTSARAKADLQDFLAAHPGIGSEPSAAPPRSAMDPLIPALRVEKSSIEAKLAQAATPSEENPYERPAPLDNEEQLKRRLKEIDGALEARTKPAVPTGAGSSQPTAADLAEWQRLVRAASEKTSEPAALPAARLRVTLARAALPRLPIEPNRVQVVLLGILLASFGGVLAGLLRSIVERRAVRRYGTITDAHPIAPLPQTTLRIPREQLPKLIAPQAEAPPTPIPSAPPQPVPMTPIPPPSRVPAPITPIPPAPIAPSPITSIPPAPVAPSPITPIPPAPVAPSPITPIPPTPLGPARVTPEPPPMTAVPPTPMVIVPATPIPPTGVAPQAVEKESFAAMVIQGPSSAGEPDGPPSTQGYGEPKKPVKPGRNAARRITKIYGTPPPPELEAEAKVLRTTQAYGSPPVAIPSHLPPEIPHSVTPFPAELLPPEHRSSVRPAPMIPLASSSAPPPVAPSTRSGAPFAETGYSYVQTPMPPAPDSIPQTPHPRRPSPPPRTPSPPPRTQPYGALPPVQQRPSQPPGTPKTPVPPSGEPRTPHPPAGLPKTPLPPAPKPSGPAVVVRTHRVDPGWRPDAALRPDRREVLAGEILTLAVERCLVVTVTGVRGMTDEKSTTAAEVAIALAEAKHPRVLLVESDFQYPQVHKWLNIGVPLPAGFSQQLRGRVDGAREGRWHVVECTPSLHVLAEGIMRSPGLLLSNRFEEGIRELRTYYDIIVIDAPVAPNEADGRAIADVVDGAFVVGPPSRAAEIVEVSRIFSGKKLLRVVEG